MLKLLKRIKFVGSIYVCEYDKINIPYVVILNVFAAILCAISAIVTPQLIFRIANPILSVGNVIMAILCIRLYNR